MPSFIAPNGHHGYDDFTTTEVLGNACHLYSRGNQLCTLPVPQILIGCILNTSGLTSSFAPSMRFQQRHLSIEEASRGVRGWPSPILSNYLWMHADRINLTSIHYVTCAGLGAKHRILTAWCWVSRVSKNKCTNSGGGGSRCGNKSWPIPELR